MKISDLVRTLQEVQAQYGDIEVNDQDTGDRYVQDVDVWVVPPTANRTPEIPPVSPVCLLSFGSYVADYETFQENRYYR